MKIVVDGTVKANINIETLKTESATESEIELKDSTESTSNHYKISEVHTTFVEASTECLNDNVERERLVSHENDQVKRSERNADSQSNHINFQLVNEQFLISKPEALTFENNKANISNYGLENDCVNSYGTKYRETIIVRTCDIHNDNCNSNLNKTNNQYKKKRKASSFSDDIHIDCSRLTQRKKQKIKCGKSVVDAAVDSRSATKGNNSAMLEMISKYGNDMYDENIDSEPEVADRIGKAQRMDPTESPTRKQTKKKEKRDSIESCNNLSSKDDEDWNRDLENFHGDISDEDAISDLEIEAKEIEEMLEILDEKAQLSDESIQRLQSLKVQLRHTVSPQHQVETHAGSHAPTRKQRELFEYYGPLKKGVFTREEDTTICNNWKAFCKLHEWDSRDVKPFLYMRHKGKLYITKFKERQKFVQFLADGLPWRTLYSVYHRFRNMYHQHLQTRYKPEDDRKIMAHMTPTASIATKNVCKFSELALVLGRTRDSVWRRYHLLKKKRGIRNRRITWTTSEIKKFIVCLTKLTLSDNIQDLKDATIPNVVWMKLGDKLNVEASTLKNHWHKRLHMQLFCTEKIHLNDIKMKLIEYFYVKGISDLRDVVWSDVAKDFDGMTPLFLLNIFSSFFYRAASYLNTNALYEVVEYLHAEILPKLQMAAKDKCLPRITYEKGKIKFVDTPEKLRIRRKTL